MALAGAFQGIIITLLLILTAQQTLALRKTMAASQAQMNANHVLGIEKHVKRHECMVVVVFGMVQIILAMARVL